MSHVENDEALAGEEAGQRFADAKFGPVPQFERVLIPGPAGEIGIVAALIDAMAAIEAVGKENVHSGKEGEKFTGKWNYRSADDVVTAVQPALVKAGVLCVPNLIKIEREKGALQMLMEYRFFARDGSSVTVRIVSNGAGNTAYTIGAAYSYAIKYVLSQLLMIPFDDERMEMDSDASMGSGSMGSGEDQPRQRGRQEQSGKPWFERAGWSSLEELAETRKDVVDRMRALAPLHLTAMKRRLAELEPAMTWNPETGERIGKETIWRPKNKQKPTEAGSIATGPLKAEMVKVLEILKEVEAESAREAAGEEPFDTESSPRGEPEREMTPGEKMTAARKATQERSKERRRSARKTPPKDEPEAVSVAPGASETLVEGRKWLAETMLQAEAKVADQIRETLEDAEYWPIGSITEEQMTDALVLASMVVRQETVGPVADGATEGDGDV